MSLFDSLKGIAGGLLGGTDESAIPGMLSQALSGNFAGGLEGIVNKLQAGGLGPQVASWISTGSNLPISADQLRSALGDAHLQAIATSLGIPTDKVVAFLTAHLPAAVDHASPSGTL